jgi:hypothetical protein
MQILLDDDVATAGKVGVFIADERGVRQIEAGWIGRTVDKAQQVARIEISKARDFIGDRHVGAKTVEQEALELEAHVGAFSPDMEEKIARRRRRRVDRPLDRRKGFEFLRSLARMETVPEIASDPRDARQPTGEVAKPHRLDQIVQPIERRADARQGGLLGRDGDHEKDRRPRQGRIDALRIDRHPVPTVP